MSNQLTEAQNADREFIRELSRKMSLVAQCDMDAEISPGSDFDRAFPILAIAVRGRLSFLQKRLQEAEKK